MLLPRNVRWLAFFVLGLLILGSWSTASAQCSRYGCPMKADVGVTLELPVTVDVEVTQTQAARVHGRVTLARDRVPLKLLKRAVRLPKAIGQRIRGRCNG